MTTASCRLPGTHRTGSRHRLPRSGPGRPRAQLPGVTGTTSSGTSPRSSCSGAPSCATGWTTPMPPRRTSRAAPRTTRPGGAVRRCHPSAARRARRRRPRPRCGPGPTTTPRLRPPPPGPRGNSSTASRSWWPARSPSSARWRPTVDEALSVMYGDVPPWSTFAVDDVGGRVEATDTGASWELVFRRFSGTSPNTGKVYDDDHLGRRFARRTTRVRPGGPGRRPRRVAVEPGARGRTHCDR